MEPHPNISIQALAEVDDEDVAHLLHRSLSHWYETRLNQGSRFGQSHLPFIHFPRLYRRLDPEHSLGAWVDRQIVGVAFLHPRRTHVSAGIIATDPAASGCGIAKTLMTRACSLADHHGLPLRLVSSLLNLDSFSLYSRCGFQPVAVFQDVKLTVPREGFAPVAISDVRILTAEPEHAAEIALAESQHCGIHRPEDHRAILSGTVLPWEGLVARDTSGTVVGSIAFTRHAEWSMPGPGFARDESVMTALLLRALDQLRGREVVTLIPSTARDLLATMYRLGGRNIELHALQVRGQWDPQTGICIPTFLPETF